MLSGSDNNEENHHYYCADTLIFMKRQEIMKKIKHVVTLLVLLEYVLSVQAQDLFETGGLKNEENKKRALEIHGYGRGVLYIGKENGSQKVTSGYLETAISAKFIPDKTVNIFSEFRLRGGYEYGKSFLEPVLKELYADISLGRLDLRIGHQILAWGRADGINPTDNLTPKNYFIRSPEPDDIRMGNNLFRARYQLNEHIRLEGIWVPFYRYSIYRFDLFDMPDFVKFKDMDNLAWEKSGGNIGMKTEFIFRGIDGSISWFRGFDPQHGIDLDHLGIQMTGDIALDLAARAFRHNMIGADFSTTAGTFGVRGEVGLRIPDKSYSQEIFTPKTDIRYVFGVDRSFRNFLVMVQYSGQWVPDYTDMPELMIFRESGEFIIPDPSSFLEIPGMIAEQIEGFNRIIHSQTHRVSHTFLLRPSINLLHETLKIEAFAMYNLSTEELTIMPELSYSVNDNWRISLGGQYFSGPENTLNDMIGPLFNGGFLELRRSF